MDSYNQVKEGITSSMNLLWFDLCISAVWKMVTNNMVEKYQYIIDNGFELIKEVVWKHCANVNIFSRLVNAEQIVP